MEIAPFGCFVVITSPQGNSCVIKPDDEFQKFIIRFLELGISQPQLILLVETSLLQRITKDP